MLKVYTMRLILIALVNLLFVISCKKSDYLSANPDRRLIIPEKLKDYQALLDNINVMNGAQEGFQGVNPAFGEIASGEFYETNDLFTMVDPGLKNLYTWNDNIYSIPFYEWAYPYRVIYYSNVVMEGLEHTSAKPDELVFYQTIKGSALFFRSEMYHQLAQVFAPSFDPALSKEQLGLPIRKTADANEKMSRSNLDECYKQIIEDLQNAASLLPNNSTKKTQPSKCAAYALLSRVFLTMQNYDSAAYYSNLALGIHNDLLDYNSLDASAEYPIPRYNKEVIFHSNLISSTVDVLFIPSLCFIDSTLYSYYKEGDLRKQLFFQPFPGGVSFRGSYDGSYFLFGGIATDELYLIRAECNARSGKLIEAAEDMNKLLKSRWSSSMEYIPIEGNSSTELLNVILLERRKQLLLRGLRWSDLRRLNREGANLTLKRVVDGQEYTLLPNDKRYTFLIPTDVISFNSTWPQNAR